MKARRRGGTLEAVAEIPRERQRIKKSPGESGGEPGILRIGKKQMEGKRAWGREGGKEKPSERE